MKCTKIKILAIAPNQNLKTKLSQTSKTFPNIHIDVFVGNLMSGVELAKQHISNDYDVIISRGKTAALIKDFSPIPVVDIKLTSYDILRAIKLIESSEKPYAVVCFPSIATPIRLSCELLNFNITIVTVTNENKIDAEIQKLINKGYSLLLYDTIIDIVARKHGVKPIVIVSGSESIEQAFNEAIQIAQNTSSLKMHSLILEDALKNHSSATIILNSTGDIIFSTYSEENIEQILNYLRNLINNEKKHNSTKAFHLISNNLYSLSIRKFNYENDTYFSFLIEPNPVPAGNSKNGLKYSSYNDIVDMYSNSFYALTSSAIILENQINSLNQNNMPVMILGERGSGKNQIAGRLYIESSLADKPYITIDCQLLNEKYWNFISGNFNSPFFDKDNTIFISNIQALSDLQRQKLLSIMLDTNAHKRNRIILSCSLSINNTEVDPARNFIDYLPCSIIYLPPLRDLTDDIKTSSNLYLNTLNIELSKQVIGFEDNALELLVNYSWPDNFMQLKRVLSELVILTTTPYIEYETVKTVLYKETQQLIPNNSNNFNFNRTLNEMINDIVKITLTNCNGNQTKTAKKLGIGRTTLWRYLSLSDNDN